MRRLGPLLALMVIAAMCGCSGDDGGGGDAPEVDPGTSCFDASDCGDLACHCPEGDDFPGVCSTTCETDADCASAHGEEYSCSLDFCTGVNVCLNLVR